MFKRAHLAILGGFCLSVTSSGVARAEVGFDFLGIRSDSHWDCDAMLQPLATLPRQVPIGWLDDDTFGRNDRCVERLLGSKKVSKARAHLLNNTCVRNSKCWQGEKLAGYSLPQLQEEAVTPGSRLLQLVCSGAERIQKYAKKYPDIRFRVSGLLEHNMSAEAAASVAKQIAACAPDVDVVDNPMGNYPPIANAIRESHGTTVNPITSLDGVSVENADIEHWKKANATQDMTLIWGLPYNCRLPRGWIQPNLRKSCPTPDLFSLLTRVWHPAAEAPQAPPKACKSVKMMTPPWLYKSVAEDSGTGEPQANKPLLSAPIKAERINILAANGSPLGWFQYFGPSDNDTSRYYLGTGSGQSAYQLGQLAEKAAGSEWVIIQAGEECLWANAYRTGPLTPHRSRLQERVTEVLRKQMPE